MKPRRNKTLTDLELFLEFPITKSLLATELGVARSTLVIWENLAFWRIESFRNSYPKTQEGNIDRESPLSPYQAWVLGRIGRIMGQLRRSDRVKMYISKNPQDFSKHRFQQSYSQLPKGLSNHV